MSVGALYDQLMRDLHDAFKGCEPHVPAKDLETFIMALDELVRKRIDEHYWLHKE